jgi:hypothetical protein
MGEPRGVADHVPNVAQQTPPVARMLFAVPGMLLPGQQFGGSSVAGVLLRNTGDARMRGNGRHGGAAGVQ